MVEFETTLNETPAIPEALIPSRAIIYLRYNHGSKPTLAMPDDKILHQALRQLENNAAHIADVVDESQQGLIVPNAWNGSCIAGPLGSPLARAISTRSEVVGLGEDKNGQLLVAASMSGVIAFYAPRISQTAGRLSFLGHDVKDVRHSWLKSVPLDDANLRFYEADDNFAPDARISSIVPRVHLCKGRFWDTVHFDARTNYALAVREFEKAGITVVPTDDVITDTCRQAATLVPGSLYDVDRLQRFEELRGAYRLPISDAIVLLPTSGLPAPPMSNWPLSVGRYDPDPFEMVMPVVLSDSVAITVPNGYSTDGLPMGLMMVGPARLSARLFALADWFRSVATWPTLATA